MDQKKRDRSIERKKKKEKITRGYLHHLSLPPVRRKCRAGKKESGERKKEKKKVSSSSRFIDGGEKKGGRKPKEKGEGPIESWRIVLYTLGVARRKEPKERRKGKRGERHVARFPPSLLPR